MGILSGFRQSLALLRTLSRKPEPGEVEDVSFSAEVPLAGTETPLWRINVQMSSEPHGDGERLRLRAHIQTNFASALRPALAAPKTQTALPSGAAGPTRLSHRAGALAQRTATRALQLPLVRALAQPLLEHDLNTWLEVNASTASLDQGSRALLPQSEKLAALGIRPTQKSADAPMMESWAGEAPGGYAQVSLLQMDKQHLPPQLSEALGDQPFQLAATMVNTVERK